MPSESIDTEAIPDECERPDCQQIAATASDVYCEITGGRLSYPTYDARTIMAEADDYTNRLIDEATAELRSERDSLRAENERLRAQRDAQAANYIATVEHTAARADAAEAKLAAGLKLHEGWHVCASGDGGMTDYCDEEPGMGPCPTAQALGVADNRSNQ